MTNLNFVRATVSSLVICTLIACGAAPRVDHSVDETKIPITTSSEKARDAYLKGRWLLENLRVTDAHEYFLKAVEFDPEFALAHLGVANTSPTNQEFFEAFRRAVDTSANASEGERFLIAALEANVAGNPEVQLAKLEALVALFPEDERAHNAIGNFLFFNQQNYERAISSYRQAIDINPKFAPPYNLLGYALRQVGDYAGAEDAFQRYTELIPDQPNPYDSYGELLMKMGRYDESIASYEKALAIDPKFVASYIGIGTNQMFMGRFEDARSTFAKIEENARNNGERRQAHFWTAASYLHEGDFESAFDETQKLYDIAAATDDRSAMAGDLNLMGNIFLRAGRVDEAAEKYNAQIEMMQSFGRHRRDQRGDRAKPEVRSGPHRAVAGRPRCRERARRCLPRGSGGPQDSIRGPADARARRHDRPRRGRPGCSHHPPRTGQPAGSADLAAQSPHLRGDGR